MFVSSLYMTCQFHANDFVLAGEGSWFSCDVAGDVSSYDSLYQKVHGSWVHGSSWFELAVNSPADTDAFDVVVVSRMCQLTKSAFFSILKLCALWG